MLKHGAIIWAGKSSQDFGIVVENPPAIKRPARKFTKYTVPGRNGDIVEQQDAWDNYTQTYTIWAGGNDYGSAPITYSAISSWLLSPKGYQRLEDNFEPDIFREAYFVGPMEADNLLTKVGRCELSFVCKPQRFLKIGEKTTSYTQTSDLYNPTQFDAKPLIKVMGSGDGTVTLNGVTMTITGMTDYLYIDCEAMNVYRQEVENMNSLVSGSFPTISPGMNTLAFTGVTRVDITPRYFEI